MTQRASIVYLPDLPHGAIQSRRPLLSPHQSQRVNLMANKIMRRAHAALFILIVVISILWRV
jgi:hypothetical protein